ncbi:hypothetical protein [Cricetibacter osteomyelitidis]|nr:hypothetical protein [Cricetibacter osteomyelitidis]
MKNSADRSVNASCVCGFVGRVAGNIGRNSSGLLDTTRAWYLQGLFENRKYPIYYIKNHFMMTVAHESGHAVLASYAYKSIGLNNYSWVHKGSSKGVGFNVFNAYSIPKSGEKGHESMPLLSADLMKYYNDQIDPPDYYAVEYDIKSLIWLSQLIVGK